MLGREYSLNEVTPEEMLCVIGTCPAVYQVEDVTPHENRCGIGVCPAVYNVKNITPKELDCSPLPICPNIYEAERVTTPELDCGIGACPDIHKAQENYLVIGKIIGSEHSGLAELAEGQTVIEVPKALIDNRLG